MNGDLLLYQTEDGQARLEVRLDGETVWLSLNQLAELFQRDKSVISRHIRNIFDEGELSRLSTVADFATVQFEGDREVKRDVEYYNLDVIISVGYRVKSTGVPNSESGQPNVCENSLSRGLRWTMNG